MSRVTAREKISEGSEGVASDDLRDGRSRSSGAVNGGVMADIVVPSAAGDRERSCADEKSANSGSYGKVSCSAVDVGRKRMLCGLISPWTICASLCSHDRPVMSLVARSCQEALPKTGSNIVLVDNWFFATVALFSMWVESASGIANMTIEFELVI